jgi:hypothetical protein
MKATKKGGESDKEGKSFFIPFITIYSIRTTEMVPETKAGFFHRYPDAAPERTHMSTSLPSRLTVRI